MGEGSLGARSHAHSYKDADESYGYEMMKAVKILMMMNVISLPWGSHRHGHRNHCKNQCQAVLSGKLIYEL